MGETGVIKFNCNWIKEDPLEIKLITDLNAWRNKLFELGFIGVYENGIGYGNISLRFNQNQFIISGTATGKFPKLNNEQYTIVTEYNLNKNSLTAQGPIIASSESLTHAVIYESDKDCNAVIHVHHLGLWSKLLNSIPTTDKKIEYGTPAMAEEVKRLFKQTDLQKQKILVMAGHEEGIISFGKDLDEAGSILMEKFKHNFKNI